MRNAGAEARRLRSSAGTLPAVLALVGLLLLASCSGGGRAQASPGRSPDQRGLTQKQATQAALLTWGSFLNAEVAVDPPSLAKSEAGHQLQIDQAVLRAGLKGGEKENQYQPTATVEWVAYPRTAPQLAEIARITTVWGSGGGNWDRLALFVRSSVDKPWHILSAPELSNPSATQVAALRSFGQSSSSRSSPVPNLPIAPASLGSAYLQYVGGGNDQHFAAGPFTDQVRSSNVTSVRSWDQAGISITFPADSSWLDGVYPLGQDGDWLVFFGTRYDWKYDAQAGHCVPQGSTPQQEYFPTAYVPAGKYAEVRVQYSAVYAAIESPSTSSVDVVAGELIPVGASTQPTTEPSCM